MGLYILVCGGVGEWESGGGGGGIRGRQYGVPRAPTQDGVVKEMCRGLPPVLIKHTILINKFRFGLAAARS